jgi:catalase (peroxidase I)
MRVHLAQYRLHGRWHHSFTARPRSNVQQLALGYSGSYYVQYPSEFTNEYFQILLENRWVLNTNKTIVPEYMSVQNKNVFVLESDLALIWDPEFKAIVEEYATDEAWFKKNFAQAWKLLMDADMYLLDFMLWT